MELTGISGGEGGGRGLKKKNLSGKGMNLFLNLTTFWVFFVFSSIPSC